jgi:hypothetical protein
MSDTLELITPREAYEIASQWGSYMRNGDPGAVFYSFATNDATPDGPQHRALLIAYTLDCLKGAKGQDKRDLQALLKFFQDMPDSGAEYRETYHAESARLIGAADKFTRAYLTAAMFTGVEFPDGHPDKDSDKEYDLPADQIEPDSLRSMIADAVKFQADNADLLAEAYARDGYGNAEWSGEEQAGHDFWLTRNGHGAGFWDRSALDADGLGDKLSDAAKAFGECDLYRGDAGGIHAS